MIPEALESFDWQTSYLRQRAACSPATVARAVAIANRVADHFAAVEFAELICSTRMGAHDAAGYGSDAIGGASWDLGVWLHHAAESYLERKTDPIVAAAHSRILKPESAIAFEVDDELRGRLPVELVALALLVVPRQRSRRLIVRAGALDDAAAGIFHPGAEYSEIVLDVACCDACGPDYLTEAFAHELAHAVDPDLTSPDRERFVEHLAPLILASRPATVDALDLLIDETVEAIGRAAVEPVDMWDEVDYYRMFECAPLSRVPTAAAPPSPSLVAVHGPASGAAPGVNAPLQREGPSRRGDSCTTITRLGLGRTTRREASA